MGRQRRKSIASSPGYGETSDSYGSVRLDSESDIEIQELDPLDEKPFGLLHMVSLGIGAVIGGNIFGWTLSVSGGIGSIFVFLLPIGFVYLCLCFCVCELVICQSKYGAVGGGAPAIVERQLGRGLGFFIGVTEVIKLFCLTAAISLAACGFLLGSVVDDESEGTDTVLDTDSENDPTLRVLGISLGGYAIFGASNVIGLVVSANIQTFLTVCSCALLITYYISMLFSPKLSFTENAIPDGKWFTGDIWTILSSVPYLTWFFLGVEEVPLAAELTAKPSRTVSYSIIISLFALFCFSICTLFFGCSLPPGIEDLPNDPAPILSGFETLTSDKVMLICIRIVMVWAILAGFCTFVFFASQVTYSLACAGHLPKFLAQLHPRFGTPVRAIALLCVTGYGILVTSFFVCDRSTVGSQSLLIFIILVVSIISYFFQCVAFLHHRGLLSFWSPTPSQEGRSRDNNTEDSWRMGEGREDGGNPSADDQIDTQTDLLSPLFSPTLPSPIQKELLLGGGEKGEGLEMKGEWGGKGGEGEVGFLGRAGVPMAFFALVGTSVLECLILGSIGKSRENLYGFLFLLVIYAGAGGYYNFEWLAKKCCRGY